MQSNAQQQNPQSASDTALVRSIRFALVCLLLGISYLNIRVTLAIPHFRTIMADMLEGAALPWTTTLVLRSHSALLGTSLFFAVATASVLFIQPKPKSFYFLGVLALATLVQVIFICSGLTGPLITLEHQLGDASK